MVHQMKNLCVFSVFYCVEGAFDAASRGTPELKMGLREMISKMVVVLSGPLDRLNAILSLLQPLDRYRAPSAIGSAIGMPHISPYLASPHRRESSTASF